MNAIVSDRDLQLKEWLSTCNFTDTDMYVDI